jgi:hypothetical protein
MLFIVILPLKVEFLELMALTDECVQEPDQFLPDRHHGCAGLRYA